MVNVAIVGMGVTYIRSSGEHVPARIFGPSTCGDGFFDVKYMRISQKILLMTVLSQGIRILNPFQNLQPSLLHPEGACAIF